MKVLVYLLVSLFILHIALVNKVDSRASENVNYSKAPAAANKTHQPYTRYDTTTVFIHGRDNLTQQSWVSTFWPRVDEFSQLTQSLTCVPNQTGLAFNPNLTVWVELKGYNVSLTPKRVYSEELDVIIPYYTAVVLLDKGNVSGFEWNDGCAKYCNPNTECIDDQCGNHRNSSGHDICVEKVDCDIKVFLAWSGRDHEDTPCKSIASIPSNFRQISVASITTLGNGLWDDFIYGFTTHAPNPVTGQTGD